MASNRPCDAPEGDHMAKVTPLKNGMFRVTWYDGAGVRHRKNLPKQKAQELYEQICAGKLFENSGLSQSLGKNAHAFRKMKFCELAERYKTEHLSTTRAGGNAFYIEILIRKWGERRLNMIDEHEFNNWLLFALRFPIEIPYFGKWAVRPLAARSVEKLQKYMKRVFTWSIEMGIISQTPFIARVRNQNLIKEFRRRKNYVPVVLNPDEFRNLIDSFPAYVRRPAMACYFGGFRRSEIAIAKWSRLDRKNHCITFDACDLKEAYDKKVFYDPELEPVFEELEIERLTNGYKDDSIFRGVSGAPLTADSFTCSVCRYSDLFAEKSKIAKYAKVSPHTFRRCYRTNKDLEGADRRAVAKNMGHRSLVTSEIYNIVDEDRQRSVAGSFNDANEELSATVRSFIEVAKKSGMELADIQSRIRRTWADSKNKAVL
jgi:integrase